MQTSALPTQTSDQDVTRSLAALVQRFITQGEPIISGEDIERFVWQLRWLAVMEPAARENAYRAIGALTISALCSMHRAANQANHALYHHLGRLQ